MDKTQIISKFNEHFLEFVEDIEQVFPNDTEITSAKKAINRGLILMPKMMIKAYKDYFVDDYGEEIDKGDLDFFINNDYKAKNNLFQKDSVKIIFDKIDAFRGPISKMSPSEKEKIIKYLQNLKMICVVYENLKNSKNEYAKN